MASVFNPDTFLNIETTEANETTYTPIPEGEHVAVIKEIKPRVAKDATILDVYWGVDEPEIIEVTGMKSPIIRQTVFLDISENGGLAVGKGKNVQLGKLREAVGQNQNGKKWSPADLLGQVAKIKVVHRMYENEPQADVKGVTAV